jgi:uncharacterized metal-binding protein YceD (DUF177 family)
MSGDFGHDLPVNSIRDGDRVDIVADEVERAAVAKRLGLLSLDCFKAHCVIERDGSAIRARGRVQASLEQPCVATGDPVAEHIDEAFDLLFVPEPNAESVDDEIELGEGDCDAVFFDGRSVDIGSAVADTLALAMNPYPRSAGAEAALKEAGVLREEQAGPFAALAKLKRD